MLSLSSRVCVFGGWFALSSCAVGNNWEGEHLVHDGAAPDAPSDARTHDAAVHTEAGGTVDSGSHPSHADAGSTEPDVVAPMPAGGCSARGYTGAIATFDLSSMAGSETSATATSVASGATASALTRSTGLTAVSGSGSLNSSGWPTTSAADPGRYYTFVVTPAVGCTLALSSLVVDVHSSTTGPSMAAMASSVDAFAVQAPFAATGSATVSPVATPSSAAIEVRIYGFGASGSTGTMRVQNTLTLSGSLE